MWWALKPKSASLRCWGLRRGNTAREGAASFDAFYSLIDVVLRTKLVWSLDGPEPFSVAFYRLNEIHLSQHNKNSKFMFTATRGKAGVVRPVYGVWSNTLLTLLMEAGQLK